MYVGSPHLFSIVPTSPRRVSERWSALTLTCLPICASSERIWDPPLLSRALRSSDPRPAVLAQGVRYGLPVHQGRENDQDPHASLLVPVLRTPGPGAVVIGLGDLRYPDPHLLEGHPRRFAPGTHPSLLVDVRQVTLDSRLREVHLSGYLVVGEAPGYVHQDLRLALGERPHGPIAHPL